MEDMANVQKKYTDKMKEVNDVQQTLQLDFCVLARWWKATYLLFPIVRMATSNLKSTFFFVCVRLYVVVFIS